MRDVTEIGIWLHGTVRAWLVAEDEEMRTRLYAEAIALLWVINGGATWAEARSIFEEVRVKLDKEMSWCHVQTRSNAI